MRVRRRGVTTDLCQRYHGGSLWFGRMLIIDEIPWERSIADFGYKRHDAGFAGLE